MISCFELKKFTRSEIQNEVRKTNFFADKEIIDALQEKYEKLEETMKAQRIQLQLQKNQLDNGNHITANLKRKLEEDPNMCLAENGGNLFSNYSNNVEYRFNDSELINKVVFTLTKKVEGYTIEFSMHGLSWTKIADFTDIECDGRQVVYFKKTRMKYLRIQSNSSVNSGTNWIKMEDGDVVAVLDTTTGVRKNEGQGRHEVEGDTSSSPIDDTDLSAQQQTPQQLEDDTDDDTYCHNSEIR